MAGRLERQKHRLRRAEAAFRRAIELEPGLVRAHRELVYLFGMQLRRREVDTEFKALSRLAPLSHHDLFTWTISHFTIWSPDIADDLESFIKADPDDRHSRLALAKLLVDMPEAKDRVERALEPLPSSDLEATALRVELSLNHGHIDEAIAMLQKSPAGGAGLERIRGRAALVSGDHRAAIDHFRNALSAEPYDRVSLSDLGKALSLVGDQAAASSYLTRARRLDDVYNLINRVRQPGRENQAADLTELGIKCEAAGLVDEARGWYLLAIGRDPLDAAAKHRAAATALAWRVTRSLLRRRSRSMRLWCSKRYITSGHPDIDADFWINSRGEAKARALLDNPEYRRLLLAQTAVWLKVKDHAGWLGPRFPENVDMLIYELIDIKPITDVASLQSLFDLIGATLEQLCRIGSAARSDPWVII